MGQVTYEEACEYILDIPKFAGKHTLADTKEMLGRLTGSRIESKIIHSRHKREEVPFVPTCSPSCGQQAFMWECSFPHILKPCGSGFYMMGK